MIKNFNFNKGEFIIISTKVMGLIGLATRAGKIVFGTDACLEQIIKKC